MSATQLMEYQVPQGPGFSQWFWKKQTTSEGIQRANKYKVWNGSDVCCGRNVYFLIGFIQSGFAIFHWSLAQVLPVSAEFIVFFCSRKGGALLCRKVRAEGRAFSVGRRKLCVLPSKKNLCGDSYLEQDERSVGLILSRQEPHEKHYYTAWPQGLYHKSGFLMGKMCPMGGSREELYNAALRFSLGFRHSVGGEACRRTTAESSPLPHALSKISKKLSKENEMWFVSNRIRWVKVFRSNMSFKIIWTYYQRTGTMPSWPSTKKRWIGFAGHSVSSNDLLHNHRMW